MSEEHGERGRACGAARACFASGSFGFAFAAAATAAAAGAGRSDASCALPSGRTPSAGKRTDTVVLKSCSSSAIFGRPVVGQRGGTTGSRYERPSTWPRADMLSCSSSWKREAASAHADADAITYDVDSGALSTAGTRSR